MTIHVQFGFDGVLFEEKKMFTQYFIRLNSRLCVTMVAILDFWSTNESQSLNRLILTTILPCKKYISYVISEIKKVYTS
jgi:hypothetical protein